MRLTHINGSWPSFFKLCHLQCLAVLFTVASLVLLFSTLKAERQSDRSSLSSRIGAGRKMSAMEEDGHRLFHTNSVQRNEEMKGHVESGGSSSFISTSNNMQQKDTSLHSVGKNASVVIWAVEGNKIKSDSLKGKPLVQVFQLTRESKAHPALVQDALRHQIRSQGFILAAPPEASRKTPFNRTVTDDDIRRTLAILDRKLEEGKKQLNASSLVGPAVAWNTTHPQRLLLVTSWRSGSTFLGQMLSNHPGVFNHYEPLMHFGIRQIRYGNESIQAIRHLTDLLHCKYTDESYMRKVKENMGDMVSHNAHLWESCILGPNRNTCGNTSFLQEACGRFPFLTMKIVRLRLNLTETLLRDPSLQGLKVLYLVRDPRATMNSRLGSVKWCAQSPDCIQAKQLCDDIESDLNAFEDMSSKYPGRLALIKYETLASQPQKSFKAIFEFAGLLFTRQIQDVVLRHTSRDEENPWSTVRKSAERVHLWRHKLGKDKIQDIQAACRNVLGRLGYTAV